MTGRLSIIVLLIVGFATGLSSFIFTRNALSDDKASEKWLTDASEQVLEMEQEFNSRAGRLADELETARSVLGLLLAEESSTNERILSQAAKTRIAHSALMRFAGTHAIELRNELSADSAKDLMSFCAKTVCGCGGDSGICAREGHCGMSDEIMGIHRVGGHAE